MSPIMVGWWRKLCFLEALKTAYSRLKIVTIIKILVNDCLNYLKITQKNNKKINEGFFQ